MVPLSCASRRGEPALVFVTAPISVQIEHRIDNASWRCSSQSRRSTAWCTTYYLARRAQTSPNMVAVTQTRVKSRRGRYPARSALFATSSLELATGFPESQPCIVALIRHSICMRAQSVRGGWRGETRLHAASAWRIFLERRSVEACIVSSVVVSFQHDVASQTT